MTESQGQMLEKRREKAFQFAGDAVKQMITISTGVIGITAVLIKEQETPLVQIGTLVAAWVLYFVSILFGVLCLLNLAGDLAKENNPEVFSDEIKNPVKVQILLFLSATLLIIIYGVFRFPLALPSL